MCDSLTTLEQEYRVSLESRGYAASTIANRRSHLGLFIRWLEARDVDRARAVTPKLLQGYRLHLIRSRKADGRALSRGTQAQRLSAVKVFFGWLTRTHQVPRDPSTELRLPRRPRRLPRVVLTADEVERVLACPDTGRTLGLRDRTIIELLYSTAIRRAECCEVELGDLDLDRGLLFVRQGKGGHDRVVPVGERAIRWIRRWNEEGRPVLANEPDPGSLFLSRHGRTMRPKRLSGLVARHVDQANLGKRGACHLFRHTTATLMLEGGADIRHIQEILGHARLSTTAVYTHVSIRHLQEVHRRTHPAENVAHRCTIILSRRCEKGTCRAEVFEMPGCVAEGTTYQEALQRAEALVNDRMKRDADRWSHLR